MPELGKAIKRRLARTAGRRAKRSKISVKWSYSTHTKMRRCQRQFAFSQLIANPLAKDPERHEAYILKQLKQLSTWQGSVVHKVLSTVFLDDIANHRPVDSVKLAAAAQDLARRQYAFSAARRYREPGMTKKAAGDDYCALYAHEYVQPIPPEALAEVYQNLSLCFEHLASQNEFLTTLAAGRGHRVEQTLFFRLADAPITAKPDLLFFTVEQQPIVVDWKVGESETSDYSRQLLVYALAIERCGYWPSIRAETTRLYEVNLLKNQISQHALTAHRLDEAEDFIYRSVVEMEALVGADTSQGFDLDELEVAEHPTTCRYCTFRPLCLHYLEQAGRAEEVALVQGRLWQ